MSEKIDKKAYTKPKLKKYGDISSITKGAGDLGGDYNSQSVSH